MYGDTGLTEGFCDLIHCLAKQNPVYMESGLLGVFSYSCLVLSCTPVSIWVLCLTNSLFLPILTVSLILFLTLLGFLSAPGAWSTSTSPPQIICALGISSDCPSTPYRKPPLAVSYLPFLAAKQRGEEGTGIITDLESWRHALSFCHTQEKRKQGRGYGGNWQKIHFQRVVILVCIYCSKTTKNLGRCFCGL